MTNVSWLVLGQMLWIDQSAGGVGQGGLMQVTNVVGNAVTLLNISAGTGIPLANTTQPGLLTKLSGNATDFVDGTNTCQNLVGAVQPTIWSARLRSFNAIGNPNFEVDQRNVGTATTSVNGVFVQDRWSVSKNGTMAMTDQQIPSFQNAPSSSFLISQNCLRFTLTTQSATLAASDYFVFNQMIEGPLWRELAGDVHSLSLLVRSSVAGLKFGVALRDSPPTRSLVKLCTIPSANTWTLITLPNLPGWLSGNFGAGVGLPGYQLVITLACGATGTTVANDAWQSSNFFGAIGQSNFAASPVNSTFDISMAQHEPGAICSQFIDKPFPQNYDECQRYFQKNVAYAALPLAGGGQTILGFLYANAVATTTCRPSLRFKKTMAKTPTLVLGYNGVSNTVYLEGIGSVAVGTAQATDSEMSALALATNQTGGANFMSSVFGNWYADTGW
jgi:hypothetical protein